MCPLGDHEVAKRGSIPAGGMIAADLKTGKFYDHKEIVDHLAAQAPYEEWLSAVTELDPEIGPGEEPAMFAKEELLRRQTAAGYSLETLELILSPMVESGARKPSARWETTRPRRCCLSTTAR
jgi:glutamate synthase (NADPH/NADH) large chain